ncbi:MAG: CHAP domain-containing protein [Lactobacillus crispatus]|nr:CHAP domain-containing protein [Lactobacillus crispatus]
MVVKIPKVVKFALPVVGVILLIFIAIIGAFAGNQVIQQQQQDNCDTEETQTASPVSGGKKNKVKGIKVKEYKITNQKTYIAQIKELGKAIGKKIGVRPAWVFAQLYAESGPDGSQPVNRKDHNLSGMSWSPGCGYAKGTSRGSGGSEGGWYRHYKNFAEFGADYATTLRNDFAKTGKPRNVSDYVNKLKNARYMATSDIGRYKTNMRTALNNFWGGKSTLSGAVQVAEDAGTDTGENCGSNGGDDGNFKASGDILKEAKKWLHKFHYSYGRSANAHWKHPSSNDTTDCSGFVWLVLKRAGYKVPSSTWATPSMESDAKGSHKWLKRISSKSAGPGDIIIVNQGGGGGQSGHTAILLEKYKGNCMVDELRLHVLIRSRIDKR